MLCKKLATLKCIVCEHFLCYEHAVKKCPTKNDNCECCFNGEQHKLDGATATVCNIEVFE
jgi:hypothetical protein